MVPHVTAALSAYGSGVLAQTQDDADDATVGFGRRLLQRIFGRKEVGEPLPPVLAKVVTNLGDLDYLGTLRATIRDALERDAQMLAGVREILAQAKSTVIIDWQGARADRSGVAQGIVADGSVNAQGAQIGDHGTQVNYFIRDHDHNRATSGRLSYFFTVGGGVANRMFMLLGHDRKDLIAEFADALSRTGAGPEDMQYLAAFAESDPLESGRAYLEAFGAFMDGMTAKIRSRATPCEYQWYTLGRLLYGISVAVGCREALVPHGGASPDMLDELHVGRDALSHMAESMDIPSGLRRDIIAFARDEGSFEDVRDRAKRLAETCRQLL
jgi:hypothetical protein